MAKRFIIGAAIGFDAEALRVFLRSASQAVPDCDVLLISHTDSAELTAEMRRFHPRVRLIKSIDAEERLRRWRTPRRARKLRKIAGIRAQLLELSLRTPWRAYGLATLHPTVARHPLIEEALERGEGRDAEAILLADTRDVYFQGDPFDFLPVDRHSLLMGAEGRMIRGNSHIVRFMNQRYAPSVAEKLKGKEVLCAGLVMGHREAIASYVRAMADEVRTQAASILGRFVDQPLHNKVIYSDEAAPFKVTREGDPWLANLLYHPPEPFLLDESGLKTREGDLVRIVHRYDRYEDLRRWTRRRYGTSESVVETPPLTQAIPFPPAAPKGMPVIAKAAK